MRAMPEDPLRQEESGAFDAFSVADVEFPSLGRLPGAHDRRWQRPHPFAGCT